MGTDLKTRLIAAAIATLCSSMVVLGSLGLAEHYAKQGTLTQSLAKEGPMPDNHRLAAATAARRT